MTTIADHVTDAAAHVDAAQESFERCDTDGYATQWAHGVNAALARTKADLAANNNKAEFPALFDLDGNLLPAKLVDGRFGMVWAVLVSDDPHSDVTRWINPSLAQKDSTRRANNAKKGVYEGVVLAPAAARLAGSGTGMAGALTVHPVVFRTDRGFSRNVTIVDNGH